MTPQSSAAIPAGLKENEILLPDYLLRQHGGILVNLSLFPAGGGFAEYLDQLFGGGARFQGLDYGVLSDLLYDYDSVLDTHGIGAKVKLAEDVVAFPPLRRALYKAVKVDAESKRAEYLFEPVQIEVDSVSEFRIKLREQGFPQERVFLNDEGSLDWCYELPEIAP